MVLPTWFVLGQAPGGVTPAVWYKADAGVYSNAGTTAAADNATVQQWNDQMGTGYNLAQATAGQRPTFSNQSMLANFNPTVSFNADFMAADPGTGNAIINRAQGSIYISGKMNTVGAAGLAGFDATMDYPGLHTSQASPNDKLLFYTAGSGYTTNSTNSFTATKAFVAGSSWLNGGGTPGSNVLAKVWLDGNENIYTNTDGNVNAGNGFRIFRIGGDSNWGSLNGQLNETIVFANPLSASEKTRVDSYLSVKWGSTLLGNYVSSGNTVVWNTSATYQNNILGIARDNNGALYQKQSRSENPNQKLIIGAGNSLANTNAANTNTLTDGQFLIVGDNGLKQSLTTPLVYTGGSNGVVNYRFEAIWKVENTGNVGTVTIAWPKGVKNLYLVQSGDAAFDGTDTFAPMATEVTINGVVYNTASVTLANGQYFTFAGYMYAPGGIVSAAWYRADAAVYSDAGTTSAANNATIQQWNEFNGLGTNISQATLANRPVYSNSTTLTNFNPTVTFDGSNDILLYQPSTNGNVNILDRSKGALFSAGNITGIAMMLGFGPASDDPGLYSFSGTNNLLLYPVIGEYDAISTGSTTGHYIGGGTWENGAGVAGNNSVLLSLRGNHQVFNTNIQNVLLDAARNDLRVGGDTDYARLNGQQNEVIIFPNKLTDDEVTKVESYLAVKYGQTLSSTQNRNYLSATGNVIWDGTNNSAYYNNIVGIGRENVSALNQKQSKSVNTDQKLIIGAGNSLANTNAANTNTLSDGQFLLVGDNGLKQTLTTPLAYTGGANGDVNYRFESIWKAQNTGAVGTVTVAWPKGVNNLYVVQSTDAAFDGTDTFTSMATEVTVNGVVYNTAAVTLGNGQYFTLAGLANNPGGIATFPGVWYKSENVSSTQWIDASINKLDLTSTNGVTTNPGNQQHNFNTWTTGYSTTKYYNFLDPNYSTNYNAQINPVFGNFNNDGVSYMPLSIYGVARATGATNGQITGLDNEINTGHEPGLNANVNGSGLSPNFYRFSNGINQTVTSLLAKLNETSIYFAHPYPGDGTATGTDNLILGLNGSEATITGQNKRSSVAGPYLKIGFANGLGFFNGDIQEVIWYKNILNTLEKQKVDTYLALKYGTTLSHDYINPDNVSVYNLTTNAGYVSNIAGIVHDDINGAINQKQSNSVNVGNQVLISTTGLANTNDANTSSLNNKQYLVWGDNGLEKKLAIPLSYTAGSNGATNFRFESIWKVQNTGTVGTVTVAWPKGIKNLYLVQSANATFASGNTFTPMTTEVTVNGVVYNTANVTLADGQFFTFAGFGHAPGGVTNSLSYWYRADVDAANTGPATDVTTWKDVWSGTTVAQLGTNPLPKYVTGTSTYFNFNPGINFTAGTQSLGNYTVRTFSADSYDVFTFTKEGMTSGGSWPSIFRSAVDNAVLEGGLRRWDGLAIQMDNGIERLSNTGGNTDTGVFTPAGAFSTTIPSIMYHTFTANSTTRALNGAANFATTNHAGTGIRNLNGGHLFGDSRFSLSTSSDNRGFIGHLGETIIYGAGNITATERRRVDSYLAIKYGITMGGVNTDHYLDADGNMVWNGGTNTTYNNNVFGVAREDIGLFEQKVSKSVNAGTILTLATTNDFVNPNLNAARTGFANDKTYFLLGDNNNVTTTPVDITVGTNTYKRIQRVWMAQEKDADAGSLFIEADLTAYNSGTFVTTSGKVIMLIADDAAFTTNVVKVNPTSNAIAKWVFNQNVADGKFITFAVDPCYGPDTDGDGVADMCDQDSDNDGILDTDEMYCDQNSANMTTQSTSVTKPGQYVFFNWPNSPIANGTTTNFTYKGIQYTATISNYQKSTSPASTQPLVGTDLSAITWGGSISGILSKNLNENNKNEALYTSVVDKGSQSFDVTISAINALSGQPLAYPIEVAVFDAESTKNSDQEKLIVTTTGSVFQQIEKFGSGTSSSTTGAGTNTVTYFATEDTNNFPAFSTKGESVTISTTLSFKPVSGSQQGVAFAIRVYCNTDGDGIPNYLDLDSDGDGCPDAIEGTGGFTTANLVNSAMPGGNSGADYTGTSASPVSQNLGNTVGANGIPVIANGGQGIGYSQSSYVNACIDTDNDGKPDIIDLDNDNDGIPNLIENCGGYYAQNVSGTWKGNTASNLTVTAPTTGLQSAANFNDNLNNFYVDTNGATQRIFKSHVNNSVSITYNFSPGVPANELAFYIEDLDGLSNGAASATYSLKINGGDVNGWMIKDMTTNYMASLSSAVMNYDPVTGAISSIGSVNDQWLLLRGVGNNLVTSVTLTSNNFGTNDAVGYGLFGRKTCDTDGDGIPNYLDLDSDGDGCPDAIEGAGGFTTANLVNSSMPGGNTGGGYTGTAGPVIQNLGNTVGNTATTMGIPTIAGTGQAIGSSANASVSNCTLPYCYKPGITTGTALDTKVGITALNRAGVNADNWPMTRKGGWLALESKTKGFVPNKVAFSGGNPVGIALANFVEGMMVYDTTNKCMKMYTQKEGEPSMAWHCITTQTCPD